MEFNKCKGGCGAMINYGNLCNDCKLCESSASPIGYESKHSDTDRPKQLRFGIDGYHNINQITGLLEPCNQTVKDKMKKQTASKILIASFFASSLIVAGMSIYIG